MAGQKAPSRIYPEVRRLASGPWVGVRDATDPVVSPGGQGEGDGANYLLSAVNMYKAQGPFGRAWYGRPGLLPMVVDTTANALGSAGVRTGQAIYTWTKEDGTTITVGICGGKFYTYDWATNVWTNTITAANLATATVTLSTTARVALVPFAGVLIVSDGVNTPWSWDGTAGAGGITKLTNAPVCYGPPKVYYAKLVMIKATERNTIVWSEEATPNTGYEAGGYNNAWTIGQSTNANILTALEATNEALIVYRERGTTTVTGAMNEDFQTAGTRASVDETIGTKSPWAVKLLSSVVFAPDADARPHGVVMGASLTRLWEDCEVTARSVIRSSLSNAQTVRMGLCGVVLLGVGTTGNVIDSCLVFDVLSGQYQGIWSGFSADVMGEVIDASGAPRVAMFGDSDGVPYVFEVPDEAAVYTDRLASGTVAIAHSVKPRYLFRDLDREIQVDRIGFGIGTVGTSSCSIGFDTTRGTYSPLSVTLSTATGGAAYDSGLYDSGTYAGQLQDRRAEVGCVGMGRWVVPEFRHAVSGETCSVTDCRVVGFEDGADTDIP